MQVPASRLFFSPKMSSNRTKEARAGHGLLGASHSIQEAKAQESVDRAFLIGSIVKASNDRITSVVSRLEHGGAPLARLDVCTSCTLLANLLSFSPSILVPSLLRTSKCRNMILRSRRTLHSMQRN